jgi:hypothetical protein
MARLQSRTVASCLGVLVAALLLPPIGAQAADSAPGKPVAALQLRDGRVLHNATVIADEGDSVVIRADEGLFKMAKDTLPQVIGASYPAPTPTPVTQQMVMVPFNPSPVDTTPVPEPRPKPKPPVPSNVPNPTQTSNLSFRGCTIVSFQPKAFQSLAGCAEVVIANNSEAPVVIFPRNLVCLTSTGARLQGRFMVSDGFPPIIKRRDVVPAQGSLDEIITFANDAIDISSVQWTR